MADWQDERSMPAHVIETAAGTTSPDNAKSGKAAYVIAVVAVAVLALLGSAVAGCSSMVLDLVEAGGTAYEDGIDQYEEYLDEYLENHQAVDNLGVPYHNGPFDVDGSEGWGLGDDATVEDLLDSELGLYQPTIDSLLPASSYANAQTDVREYVRSLVLVDRDASGALATTLHKAAWGDADTGDALTEALELANETIDKLRELESPKVEGKDASSISRNLEVGQSRAVDRWKSIADELELLQADELDTEAVHEADDAVIGAATEAAEALGEALSESAAR